MLRSGTKLLFWVAGSSPLEGNCLDRQIRFPEPPGAEQATTTSSFEIWAISRVGSSELLAVHARIDEDHMAVEPACTRTGLQFLGENPPS